MARITKKGLDYFPFDVNFFVNVKVRRLIRLCGAESVAILLAILCSMYRDDGYFLKWNENAQFVLSDISGVPEEKAAEVVAKALEVGFFDQNKFDEYSILTSCGAQKRFLEATQRRKEQTIEQKFLLVGQNESKELLHTKVQLNGENVYINPIQPAFLHTKVQLNGENVDISTQSKVKESKVKESKAKESKEKERECWSGLYPNTVNRGAPQNVDNSADNFVDNSSSFQERARGYVLKAQENGEKFWIENGEKITSKMLAGIERQIDYLRVMNKPVENERKYVLGALRKQIAEVEEVDK